MAEDTEQMAIDAEESAAIEDMIADAVSYTHLRAHET